MVIEFNFVFTNIYRLLHFEYPSKLQFILRTKCYAVHPIDDGWEDIFPYEAYESLKLMFSL